MKVFDLKPFQIPGYNNLVGRKRHLLLYRMGLGKTVVTTKAMYDVESRIILILCPKNAIRVWEDHIKEWFDGLDVASGKVTEETETSFHIWRWRKKYNDAQKRRALWTSKDRGAKINVYITTFAAFISDHEYFTQSYDTIIVDEAKRLRNRKSKAFEYLKPLVKLCKYLWLLTGTPGRQPPHFWTMLHLVDHKYFSSFWKFVGTFMYTQKNHFGGIEILGIRNQSAWDRLLEQYATILTKEMVGHQETQRQYLWVEMDDDQERLYGEMRDNMMMIVEDNLIMASTSLTQVLRYRQLLVCPKILDPSAGVGAAFSDFVENLLEGDRDPHTVVFSPFTDAFPHFKEYLNANGFPNVFILQGGLDPDEMQDRIDRYRQTKGIILCSILYATAFSLEPASECYFFGREWDPEDNAQAEERLNRLTTTYPVNAYYYAYENTYDLEQNTILDDKVKWERTTLGLNKK